VNLPGVVPPWWRRTTDVIWGVALALGLLVAVAFVVLWFKPEPAPLAPPGAAAPGPPAQPVRRVEERLPPPWIEEELPPPEVERE
jgi:hypothetical protein